MAIIPAGVKVASSSFGDAYQDREGNFFVITPRSLAEVIEARVTNGGNYISPGKGMFEVPYAENGHQEKLDPIIFCLNRMEESFSPIWKEDLREGHPSYKKTFFQAIIVNKT